MTDWEWVLEIDVKGGPGSGHWGHAGRPGQHGGSAPGRMGGAGRVNRDYFTKGSGRRLLPDLSDKDRELAIGAMVAQGVQPRHLSNLKRITTEADYYWPWEKSDTLLGLYRTDTHILHIRPNQPDMQNVLAHELGHHVIDESSWAETAPVSAKRALERGYNRAHDDKLTDSQLASLGMDDYSLYGTDEWGADTWAVYSLGSDKQKSDLAKFMGVDSLDDIFGGN